jgi:cytohesin
LLIAAMNGHAPLIPVLCNASASPNDVKSNGRSALMYAANNGHAHAVHALIQAGADVNAADNWGRSALASAVAARRDGVVEVLLECGAQINSQSMNGNITALHIAAGIGDLHIVRTLIAAGADVSLKTAAGLSPAALALAGPLPASAERHAIADLLSTMGAARPSSPASGDTHTDEAEDL